MLTAFSVGDIIDAIMAIMVVKTCQEIEGGLPSTVTMKMYSNIILDFGIGLVPLVGDMMDVLFRANMQNATILENHIYGRGVSEESGEENGQQWWQGSSSMLN